MEQPIQASVSPEIDERRAERATRQAIRTQEGEKYKVKGNECFRRGDFATAATYYVYAIKAQGPKPLLMSNLAATYLRLEIYEPAANAATVALEFDPHLTKARFRRGIARRNMFLYDGARKDFEAILQRDPDCQEAQRELEVVRGLLVVSGELEHESDDEEHPLFSDEAWEFYSDSDSPDCKHIGIGRVAQPPCRPYNREGCTKGSGCQLSHAPDRKSVRDEIGKNVCVYFLLGNCSSGDAECPYSHDRSCLPANGWWNYPDQVEAAKQVQSVVEKKFTYNEINKALRENPKAHRFGARRHREEILENLQPSYLYAMEEVQRVAAVDAMLRTNPLTDRFVLLVSLEEDHFTNIHKHLLSALKQRIQTFQVFNARQVTSLLDSPHLVAIFATDAGIARRKHTVLRNEIVKYVQNGGSCLTAGSFSTHVSGQEFEKLTRAFGLGWTYGSYHRTTFALNPSNELARRNPSLVRSYSMKTMHVGNISPEQAVYAPTAESRLQSHVFAAERITDHSEAPAVCARVGRGFFSFLGDVNAETASTSTILAMLGLLDVPNGL